VKAKANWPAQIMRELLPRRHEVLQARFVKLLSS
jgi:hypothetical protein